MLQGTFETIDFAEVLRLLAGGKKTGALHIEAGVAATLWMEDGGCRAVEGGDFVEPLTDTGELRARLVDLGFAIARTTGGTFRFADGEASPWHSDEAITVEDLLTEVEGLSSQWRQIEAVVPSLDCRPTLSDELAVDRLEVDSELWKLIVRIDGRRSVRDLAHRTGRSVLELCYTLMDLVEAGAVGIGPATAAQRTAGSQKRSAKTSERISAGAVQPEEPYGPGVESPHPGPKVAERVGAAKNGSGDKGALLQVFSGLRDN